MNGERPRLFLMLPIAFILSSAAGFLYSVDPYGNNLLPVCVFRALTGLQCPGCGSLRAAHELLHGNIAVAFRLNPLFILVVLPFGLWLAALWFSSELKGRVMVFPSIRPVYIYIAAAAAALFTIGRNIF